MLSLNQRPFVQASFVMQAPRSQHVFLSLFIFVYLEMSLFPSIFCTIAVFSLYGEHVVRSFFPDDVFLPYFVTADWIFDISLCDSSFIQSINQAINQAKQRQR